MMKSMDDNNSNGNTNTNSNDSNSSSSWLGFSLSPHMKMEVSSSSSQFHHHHETNQSPPVTVSNSSISTPSMYLAQQQNCYPHHLTVMPIKSDGSLCIMEALTRSQSQGMGPSSPPKLENFLGGANLGGHEREAMALSLDSIYYQHNEEQEEANRVFQQHQAYYLQAPMVDECSAQISQMANWVARNYPTHHGMEQNNVSQHTMVAENGCSSVGSMASMGCGDLQSLTLSMSPGSQSSSVTLTTPQTSTDALVMETKKRGAGKLGQKQPVHRKSIDTFGQRTSQYRGVTKHRWTGRYEAHLWDNSCKKEGQTRKGRQVYLGGYDMEEKAARAYDLAALKYWGPSTHINFPIENYKDELEEMKNMTRQEYVAHLRRKSSGFSRGASMYRGVTRHHQHGRWQARIGRVAGNKDLYLGTFSTQEEAAEAYDIAAIKFRGVSAVTNFDITRYDVDKIMSSNTLLAGEQAKRIKSLEAPNPNPIIDQSSPQPQINADPNSNSNSCDWKMVLCDETTFDQNKQGNNYQSSSFSAALQDLIGINSLGSAPMQTHQHQSMMDESNKINSVQFSNASSIVTSLNSSREGSPDKGVSPLNMVYPKAPVGWITPAQLRAPPVIPMAHLPGYAAWNDA